MAGMVKVSDDRWLGLPEKVWRQRPESGCQECDFKERLHPNTVSHKHEFVPFPEQWLARMPSGDLEWLTEDEWTKLQQGLV